MVLRNCKGISEEYAGVEYESSSWMTWRIVWWSVRKTLMFFFTQPVWRHPSDLGAGTIGGLGLAPSGCYGHEFVLNLRTELLNLAGKELLTPPRPCFQLR